MARTKTRVNKTDTMKVEDMGIVAMVTAQMLGDDIVALLLDLQRDEDAVPVVVMDAVKKRIEVTLRALREELESRGLVTR